MMVEAILTILMIPFLLFLSFLLDIYNKFSRTAYYGEEGIWVPSFLTDHLEEVTSKRSSMVKFERIIASTILILCLLVLYIINFYYTSSLPFHIFLLAEGVSVAFILSRTLLRGGINYSVKRTQR